MIVIDKSSSTLYPFNDTGSCDPPIKAKYLQQAGAKIAVIGQTAFASREAAMVWSGPEITIAVYDAMLTGSNSPAVFKVITQASNNITVVGTAGNFTIEQFSLLFFRS